MIEPSHNIHEFTVSELAGALKRTVEDTYGHVRLRAELSGVKLHGSGHLYLSLKDDRAAIDGVCWRGVVAKLGFRPEDGLEVLVTGRLSTYPARSKYQMVIEQMEPAGAGALMALLEARKKKLAAEGLFASERKRPLPYLPQVIAIVTSPTGAVIRDILHRLSDRFPRRVMLWPVPVQGEGAAEKIAAAIRGFNQQADRGAIPRPDVMIVARGGGSIEDLWAFNEEAVVRAVAESAIPVISAVGHETDTTLIDHASDRRAPTPTAAAEMAVPVRSELLAQLAQLNHRLDHGKSRFFVRLADQIHSLGRGLPRPQDLLGLSRQKLDDLADRLPRGLRFVAQNRRLALGQVAPALGPARLQQMLVYKRHEMQAVGRRLEPAQKQILTGGAQQISALSRLLQSLSYQGVLARGYAVLRDEAGRPISEIAALKPGTPVEAELHDGRARLLVEAKIARSKAEAPAKAPTKPKAKPKSTAGQGSLF
ncbi:exodeoxyribonuclease 7 large subunit [Iodidimonas nitroreducens]|uniref:Exodeoxyribonuclease 7 large subunit n=1 Tax=Iodidimonas nitroreducens TaxID=1236968 RepID=A0A5A7N9H2_9PROT|nr:exodeoxyribonuclease VII large subunit [Iodidimonas nitroreducens]GAK34215.1 exodeoxyribonuclease 7 large subunit [alpha proteobacterium Q-1]GER05003.1 exodeoxyribonuclease 7 large subunit [Iodidimonas nitroreducens]